VYDEEKKKSGTNFLVHPDANLTEELKAMDEKSPGIYTKMGFPPNGKLFTKKVCCFIINHQNNTKHTKNTKNSCPLPR
jgi:hypothetical protein